MLLSYAVACNGNLTLFEKMSNCAFKSIFTHMETVFDGFRIALIMKGKESVFFFQTVVNKGGVFIHLLGDLFFYAECQTSIFRYVSNTSFCGIRAEYISSTATNTPKFLLIS